MDEPVDQEGNIVMPIAIGFATAVLIVWASIGDLRFAARRPSSVISAPKRRPFGVFEMLGAPIAKCLRFIPRLGLIDLTVTEQRWMGMSFVCMLLSLFFAPLLVIATPGFGAMTIWYSRRNARNRRYKAIMGELPLTVELLSLMITCGYNVLLGLREVSEQLEGPLAAELRHVLEEVANGRRMVDALEGVVERTCEELRPLIWCLGTTERYGSPLSDALGRLSLDTRADLERRSEKAAKRLTVQLLFPVAGTTLPAFALLTVAPFIAGSLSTLAFTFN